MESRSRRASGERRIMAGKDDAGQGEIRGGDRGGRAGAIMVEYILICALVILVGAAAAPAAIKIIGSAFEMVLAVIGSPHPAFL